MFAKEHIQRSPENGGSMSFRNSGIYLQIYTVLRPRRSAVRTLHLSEQSESEEVSKWFATESKCVLRVCTCQDGSTHPCGWMQGVDVGRNKMDGSLPGAGARRTLFGFIMGLV